MIISRDDLRIVRQAMLRALALHYQAGGSTLIDDTPTVVPVTGACENVSTLFQLARHPEEYLTQTAQLSLEVELQRYEGVYCVVSSFRSDTPDRRHLQEFQLVEEEFTCDLVGMTREHYCPDQMLNHVLIRATAAVRTMLVAAIEQIRRMDLRPDGGSDIAVAIAAADNAGQWPHITYEAALERLCSTRRFGELAFGDDLRPEHEAVLIELVSRDVGAERIPVFVTHFPEAIKFFNMKTNPVDHRTVLSADLLLPTAGEAVGAAVREDDVQRLAARLGRSTMLRDLVSTGDHDARDFSKYLDLVGSDALPPHAGYGIGLERVLQYALAESDIRNVSGSLRLRRELSYR